MTINPRGQRKTFSLSHTHTQPTKLCTTPYVYCCSSSSLYSSTAAAVVPLVVYVCMYYYCCFVVVAAAMLRHILWYLRHKPHTQLSCQCVAVTTVGTTILLLCEYSYLYWDCCTYIIQIFESRKISHLQGAVYYYYVHQCGCCIRYTYPVRNTAVLPDESGEYYSSTTGSSTTNCCQYCCAEVRDFRFFCSSDCLASIAIVGVVVLVKRWMNKIISWTTRQQ